MLILKLIWICACILSIVLLHEIIQILGALLVSLIGHTNFYMVMVLALLIGSLSLAKCPKHPRRVIIFVLLIGLFGVFYHS